MEQTFAPFISFYYFLSCFRNKFILGKFGEEYEDVASKWLCSQFFI